MQTSPVVRHPTSGLKQEFQPASGLNPEPGIDHCSELTQNSEDEMQKQIIATGMSIQLRRVWSLCLLIFINFLSYSADKIRSDV